MWCLQQFSPSHLIKVRSDFESMSNKKKEQMVTQEELIQLLVQMEKELEGHLLKIAIVHMNSTSGMRKKSTYEYAKRHFALYMALLQRG